MKNRLKRAINEICSAVFLAGLLILITGIYYIAIKAGIPYPDPTAELQVQYAVNYGIGSTLSRLGLIIALCGGIVRMIIWRRFRSRQSLFDKGNHKP